VEVGWGVSIISDNSPRSVRSTKFDSQLLPTGEGVEKVGALFRPIAVAIIRSTSLDAVRQRVIVDRDLPWTIRRFGLPMAKCAVS
jgi:hypothetical protein